MEWGIRVSDFQTTNCSMGRASKKSTTGCISEPIWHPLGAAGYVGGWIFRQIQSRPSFDEEDGFLMAQVGIFSGHCWNVSGDDWGISLCSIFFQHYLRHDEDLIIRQYLRDDEPN